MIKINRVRAQHGKIIGYWYKERVAQYDTPHAFALEDIINRHIYIGKFIHCNDFAAYCEYELKN